jgi:hypothetical protein
LIHRIQTVGLGPPKIRVATRIGYHGTAYAFQDEVVAAKSSNLGVCLDPSSALSASKFRTSKDEDWSEIPKLARGNSRLMTCLALGFVGPCVRVTNLEQVGLQLAGPPESGKSSIAIAVGSIWGRHCDPNRAREHGFMETWNNTSLKFEPLALAHNHALLIADETRTASKEQKSQAAAVLDVAMRLEKAAEKGRQPDVMASRSWWVPFLSTSNKTLDELCRSENIELDDAFRGRLIDIGPPDNGFGFFENLHGYGDVVALSVRLKQLAATCYGWPSRRFIRKLVRWHAKDRKGLRSWFKKRRKQYLKHAKRINIPGRRLNRIHQKFATIYAAGCLAIKFGTFPWSRAELGNALIECERNHVSLVANHTKESKPVAQDPFLGFLSYIREHQHRFVDLRVDSDVAENGDRHLGYHSLHQGNREFLLSEKTFEAIAGGRGPALDLKKQLDRRGLIAKTQAGRQGSKYVVRRNIGPGQKRKTLVAVSYDILNADIGDG